MRTIVQWAAMALMCGAALGAEERFSQTLSPADFAASGLDRLKPEELARLDQLAQAFRAQTAPPMRMEAEAKAVVRTAPVQPDAAPTPAPPATAKPAKAKSDGFWATLGSRPAKAAPPEPETSRIIGTVSGWNPKTVFTLENGQVWTVSNYDYYTCPAVTNPAVEIRPATFGGFWMKIDALPEVRVRLVSNPRVTPAP